MKFFNLLKKELRELINAQMIISLVAVMGIFLILGNVMTTAIEEVTKNEYSISVIDRDKTEFTADLIQSLKDKGAKVSEFESDSDDYAAVLKETGKDGIVIIPEGFTDSVDKNEKAELISIARMQSAAMMSNLTNDANTTTTVLKNALSDTIAEKNGLSKEDIDYMGNPVNIVENTVVEDKSAAISVDTIMGKVMIQNEIMPIIIFVLIMMVSQMIISAISNEKIDKTLETLLSAPVSRTAIIGAKMLGAAIVAMLNAVFYMVGFSGFMKSAMETGSSTGDMINSATEQVGQILGDTVSTESAMRQLGLSLSITDYLLVGVQLFITIMICLSVSIMLGALVNDTKSSQNMILPLLMMAMVPYMISMFADINTLPMVIRVIVYAIPFTHTFSAISNLMFGHTGIFLFGLAYQTVVFVICMFFALRLFKSDKILTISLNFGQKSKFKKSTKTNEE